MAKARCLCGAVEWQLAEPLEWMAHCHCSRCRKAHGSAFATYVSCPSAGLRMSGAEHVVRWQPEGAGPRCFCRICGSVVPYELTGASIVSPAGNLLDDPGLRPTAHLFVASKAPWFEIADGLPRFDAYPPQFGMPVLPDREPLDAPGHPRGSCLCGAITFLVVEAPRLARHCHCSRCRRARSAAHASNLITSAGGVRFTRGENQLSSFKVPDARYFMQVFCNTCGSPLPRRDEARDICVIPMGALDDVPGLRPDVHIFVASKAPWYSIADELRQFPEAAA